MPDSIWTWIVLLNGRPVRFYFQNDDEVDYSSVASYATGFETYNLAMKQLRTLRRRLMKQAKLKGLSPAVAERWNVDALSLKIQRVELPFLRDQGGR